MSVFTAAEREAIGAEFPGMRGRAYLNFASVGPMPRRVRRKIDAINDTIETMDRNFDPETDTEAARARAACARLIGGQPECVGLMPNTSWGINWALRVFPHAPGDAILISDHEFPALRYAAAHMAQFDMPTVIAPVDPTRGLYAEQLESLLKEHPQVKIVATSWVYFHNGFKHDLRSLAEVAHRHGAYFVVDGIQGVGTRPLDVMAQGVDVLASAVHKWLCCPVGMGFVWCRPEHIERHPSPWAGWMSVEWESQYGDLFGEQRTMTRGPRAAEAGTTNFAGVRALAEAATWIGDLDTQRIGLYTDGLTDRLLTGLDPERFRVVSDDHPDHRSSIVCIRPRRADADAVRKHLARRGVITAVREGAVRVSPHFPTESAAIEQLVQSLHELPNS
jgi:cysteine desulfurase/selenocysteine lyase